MPSAAGWIGLLCWVPARDNPLGALRTNPGDLTQTARLLLDRGLGITGPLASPALGPKWIFMWALSIRPEVGIEA
jgi:hypothetical protein